MKDAFKCIERMLHGLVVIQWVCHPGQPEHLYTFPGWCLVEINHIIVRIDLRHRFYGLNVFIVQKESLPSAHVYNYCNNKQILTVLDGLIKSEDVPHHFFTVKTGSFFPWYRMNKMHLLIY